MASLGRKTFKCDAPPGEILNQGGETELGVLDIEAVASFSQILHGFGPYPDRFPLRPLNWVRGVEDGAPFPQIGQQLFHGLIIERAGRNLRHLLPGPLRRQ